MSDNAKLIVMVSGGGTNLQALIDAIQAGELNAKIACVFSNRSNAYALERAKAASIPTEVIRLKPYLDDGHGREQYDIDLAKLVRSHEPDLVVLAGWMHILSPAFLNQVNTRVINLHPALPGTFPGTHAIERAFESYQRGEITHSGCMVHDVIAEIDAGTLIASRTVPIYEEDTLDDFEKRLHTAEHELIVEAVRKVIET